MILSILLPALAAPTSSFTSDDPPRIALVRSFLAALDHEPEVAAAMISPGAFIDYRDTGEPLTVDSGRRSATQVWSACRETGIVSTPADPPIPRRSVIDVAISLRCGHADAGEYDAVAHFYVEGSRIYEVQYPFLP